MKVRNGCHASTTEVMEAKWKSTLIESMEESTAICIIIAICLSLTKIENNR